MHLGNVPAGSTLFIPFATYAGATGASITVSGLAVTDVEIYKNGSPTQRASDNGYALLDTDGIDFDGITGIHGFSVDLSDDSDAGFYSVGSFYWILVSSVTIDGQTVNFIAATFRIVAAEQNAGYPRVSLGDVAHGGAAATLQMEQVVVTKTGVGEPAVKFTGGQAAAGLQINGGTLGSGCEINGGSQNGRGLVISAEGVGLWIDSSNTHGVQFRGNTSGSFLFPDKYGLRIIGGAAGTAAHAVSLEGGAEGGYDLSASDLPPAFWDSFLDLADGVETGRTVRQVLRLHAAALGGKLSGAGSTTVVIRDLNDTVDRVSATVDADGNRTAVTLNL